MEASESTQRLIFSQRRLMSGPQRELQYGEIVEGKITGFQPYGMFVETTQHMMGLVHISKITSSGEPVRPENVFSRDEQIKAMVVLHNKAQDRLALDVRALERFPGEVLTNRAEMFAAAEETVKALLLRKEAMRTSSSQLQLALERERDRPPLSPSPSPSLTHSLGVRDEPLRSVSVADSIESILSSIESDDVEV